MVLRSDVILKKRAVNLHLLCYLITHLYMLVRRSIAHYVVNHLKTR